MAYEEIDKLKDTCGSNPPKGDFHLAFLFSSPLIRKVNLDYEEVQQINYL